MDYSFNLREFLTKCRKKALIYFYTCVGRSGSLPHFIVLGTQRGGTTSFLHYLSLHPLILSSLVKEVHFFDFNFHKGINWYRRHFPKLNKKRTLTGEATPYYLFHPLVPRRVFKTFPEIKFIVLLRNPVKRAYSHYWHEVKIGVEKLSFEKAINAENKRLKGEYQKVLKGKYSFNHYHFAYLAQGKYIYQLKRWFSFFPKEQFLILKSEDLFAYPSQTMKKVFRFLELPENVSISFQKKYHQLRYPPMKEAIQKKLFQYFQPYNYKLYEFLGKDFEWEKELK